MVTYECPKTKKGGVGSRIAVSEDGKPDNLNCKKGGRIYLNKISGQSIGGSSCQR